MFYSHVICSGTKIDTNTKQIVEMFYSHVICSGTKIKQEFQAWGSSFTVT